MATAALAGLMRNIRPHYNARGENVADLQCRAYAFHLLWTKFKEANYDPSVIERPPSISNDAWNIIEGLFKDDKKIAWIKKMEGANLRLRDCTDTEMCEFLTKFFTENKSTSAKYVKNVVSQVRGVFKDIGRNHEWNDAVSLSVLGINLGNTGNPVTTATQDSLKGLVTQKKKDAAAAGEGDDIEKLGAPVSIVLSYSTMLYHINLMLEKYMRLYDDSLICPKSTINLAMLNMLYALGMHEGTRQIDVVDRMIQSNQWFPLHEKVYWLTLVLLKPKTLAFLLEGNKIRAYNIGLFKGKKKQVTLNRLKAMIPCAYNSIDMVTIYVICMKVALDLMPSLIDDMHVFKPSANKYSDIRANWHKKLGLEMFTFYSFRYTGAEEDQKGHINSDWTRQRMGHSTTSDMKDSYARNKGKRVMIGDEVARLGVDVYEETTNTAHITLEFNVHDNIGIVYDTNWLDDTFSGEDEELMEDFVECHILVTALMNKEDWARDAIKEHLSNLYDTYGTDWIAEFPLGLHIKLSSELTTPSIDKIYTEAVEGLKDMFKVVPEPPHIPELVASTQTMYGNWRGLINDRTTIFVKPLTPKPKKAPKLAPKPTHETEPVPDIDMVDEDDTESVNSWEDGFKVSAIEKNDSIVINCQDPDGAAMRVGKLGSCFVWVARIKSIRLLKPKKSKKNKKAKDKEPKMATIHAQFYYNREKDITQPLKLNKKVEKMTIQETSLIHVFSNETLIKLTKSNIQDIIDFMRIYVTKE